MEPWKDCAYMRATFGDKAAALLLEVAKKWVAQEGGNIDPMAAEHIRDKLYVDDGFAGGLEVDVKRMVGDLKENGGYDGTVTRILETCGLKVKFMAACPSHGIDRKWLRQSAPAYLVLVNIQYQQEPFPQTSTF